MAPLPSPHQSSHPFPPHILNKPLPFAAQTSPFPLFSTSSPPCHRPSSSISRREFSPIAAQNIPRRFSALSPSCFSSNPRLKSSPFIPAPYQARKPSLTLSNTARHAAHVSALVKADQLQKEFGCEGLQFSDVAGATLMELKLRCGSSARVLLPSAIISSYQVRMWHGGTEEMLHTEISLLPDPEKFEVKGGITLCLLDDEALEAWIEGSWAVEGVDVDPESSIQVILERVYKDAAARRERETGDSLYFRYVITLYNGALVSAVLVSNAGCLPVRFTASVLTHLEVSSAEAAFAIGLKGCTFCPHPAGSSEVEVSESKNQGFLRGWPWNRKLEVQKKNVKATICPGEMDGPLQKNLTVNQTENVASWATEKHDHAPFKSGMSRLYSIPPAGVAVLDRGKRRSLIFRSLGFENLLMCSPGPETRLEPIDNCVCFGPATVLQPIVLNPGKTWQAAQILENPNKGAFQ